MLTLLVCDSGRGGGEGAGCYQFEDLRSGQKAPAFDLPPFVISARQDPKSTR